MRNKRHSAFRIVRTTWTDDALNGDGARKYGGRWNPRGLPCVYLAESRALAALEVLAHLTPQTRAGAYELIEVTFCARHVQPLRPARLPDGWRQAVVPQSTQEFGREWLLSLSAPVLKVPSTVIEEEHLYLLNPRHPAAREVRARKPCPFSFDARGPE